MVLMFETRRLLIPVQHSTQLLPLVPTNGDDSSQNEGSMDDCENLETSISLIKRTRSYSKWSPMEEGVTLAWNDLSVSARTKVNGKQVHKRIINSEPTDRVEGYFYDACSGAHLLIYVIKKLLSSALTPHFLVTGALKAGSLAALMGASGAGKSTLMAALGYRQTGEMHVEGEILINGRPIGSYMKHLCGFMPQDDIFVGSLTVFEHMNVMANLKLDRRVTKLEKTTKIDAILGQLGLRKCRNTRIGAIGQYKGLSGGEKKRLAFATELLTDPPILFCDEPTTGLDSFSAQKIVSIMSRMSMSGTTVLCTIHQPSSVIFDMFTQLILVADGRIAYMGGRASAIDFFESQGFNCPSSYSPADFFIKTLAMTPGHESNSRMTVKKICDHFTVSDYAKEVEVVVQYEFHMGRAEPREFELRQNFKPSFWWQQLFWLTYRWSKDSIKNPSVQSLRILQRVTIAIIVGLSFFNISFNTQKGIQAIQGLIFMFVAENTFNPTYYVLAEFPESHPLFLREFRSGLYHPAVYYVSRIIAWLPGFIIEPILFSSITYWLAGLRATSYAFLMTTLVTVLTFNVSCACGILFSCAFESVPSAMAYLVPFDYVLMITSGLFIKRGTIPAVIGWSRYLSWLMYSTESLSIIQWQGITNITCDNREDDNLPCLRDGTSVLDQYSFSGDNLGCDIWNMVFLLIGFNLLGYVFLWWKARRV